MIRYNKWLGEKKKMRNLSKETVYKNLFDFASKINNFKNIFQFVKL